MCGPRKRWQLLQSVPNRCEVHIQEAAGSDLLLINEKYLAKSQSKSPKDNLLYIVFSTCTAYEKAFFFQLSFLRVYEKSIPFKQCGRVSITPN